MVSLRDRSVLRDWLRFRAALYPATTNYTYFVATGGGTTRLQRVTGTAQSRDQSDEASEVGVDAIDFQNTARYPA